MKLILFISIMVLSISSQAGVVEVGLTGNYRNTSYDSNTFTRTQTLNGSISYYFWEMSAIELSITSILQEDVYRATISDTESTVKSLEYLLYGIDFVLSLSSREDVFQPFVKAGLAQVKKQQFLDPPDQVKAATSDEIKGIAPSAGFGFRFKLTKTFSVKAGADYVASPIGDDNDSEDVIGRIGFSWFL